MGWVCGLGVWGEVGRKGRRGRKWRRRKKGRRKRREEAEVNVYTRGSDISINSRISQLNHF